MIDTLHTYLRRVLPLPVRSFWSVLFSKHHDTEGQSGYTLVEVMVAAVIALIVMGGVYKTLTRETVDMEREEIRLDMQNNARVAMMKITQEVRRSGFLGCGGENAEKTEILSNAGDDTTFVQTLTTGAVSTGDDAYDWTGEEPLLNGLKKNALVDYLSTPIGFYNNASTGHYDTGTDALTLVYLGGDYPLNGAMTSLTDPLTLYQGEFEQGDLIVVTDCKNYSLFQKTNASYATTIEHKTNSIPYKHNGIDEAGINNTTDSLSKKYGEESQARVFHLRTSTFFVQGNNLMYMSNELDEITHGPVTIASNIEDLQFEFKYDSDNDNDISDENWWDPATSSPFLAGSPSASDIRAIKIWILARSEKISGSTSLIENYDAGTYDYPNSPYKTTPPNDNRYRYLASRVVYLRNAGIAE